VMGIEMACRLRSVEKLRLLLETGELEAGKIDRRGFLHESVRYGRQDVVSYPLGHGCDHYRDENGHFSKEKPFEDYILGGPYYPKHSRWQWEP
jgi:hypothetical protein